MCVCVCLCASRCGCVCVCLPFEEQDRQNRADDSRRTHTQRGPVRKVNRRITQQAEDTGRESEHECEYVYRFSHERRQSCQNSALNPAAPPLVPDLWEQNHWNKSRVKLNYKRQWTWTYTGRGDAPSPERDDQPDPAQASGGHLDPQPVNTYPHEELANPPMTYEEVGKLEVEAGMNNLQMNYKVPSYHTLWCPGTGKDIEVQG